ncbi:MAG TPA: DHHW family protein [Lachnospiraceae bacterium]|nr:DHHW family protein [Lachnospiraceae bacterium]
MRKGIEKNRCVSKLLHYLYAILAVGIALSICFFATVLLPKLQSKQDETLPGSYKEKYGIQGLQVGEQLQKVPDRVNEEYIYFSDRILKKFKYSKESNTFTANTINDLMDSIPDTISKYTILLPSRVTYEESALVYSDNSLDSIREIYGQLSDQIIPIDVDAALRDHTDEYIYLRTDSDITSLGAYYISKEFCKAKEIDPVDINSYKEYKFEGFDGVYTLLEESSIPETADDYISYYLKDNSTNWETVTVKRKNGTYETFETPTIALSRRGVDIFVAGEFSHAILEGDMDNGKVLLLIGDSSAKKLAVWLTPYYDKVYLVGTKWYQGGKEGIQHILKEYEITDVILTEEADHIGESVYNSKIRGFTP